MLEFIKKNWFVFVGIFIIWYFYLSHIMVVPGVIETPAEMFDMTKKAITRNKATISFKTDIDPDILDYDNILDSALLDDLYSACEFYSYTYHYSTDADGVDHVKLKIEKPRLYRKMYVKYRVKKLAKIFKDLDDYEKVKAVHDYIVTENNYNLWEGGAYEALCKGRSACNGYALAFYACMTEMGIPVTYETGDNHMWNTVMIDGEWYNIDLTWDDPGDGTVHYDYFLKCDSEWYGHEHGSSTASASLPVKGRTAEEYCSMVPNLKLRERLFVAVIIVLIIAVLCIISTISSRAKKKRKKLQDELFEKNLKQINDSIFLDNEIANRYL